jgi:hypothetical protein
MSLRVVSVVTTEQSKPLVTPEARSVYTTVMKSQDTKNELTPHAERRQDEMRRRERRQCSA